MCLSWLSDFWEACPRGFSGWLYWLWPRLILLLQGRLLRWAESSHFHLLQHLGTLAREEMRFPLTTSPQRQSRAYLIIWIFCSLIANMCWMGKHVSDELLLWHMEPVSSEKTVARPSTPSLLPQPLRALRLNTVDLIRQFPWYLRLTELQWFLLEKSTLWLRASRNLMYI